MTLTRLIFLLLLGGTLFTSSCKEDEVNPNEATNSRLEGVWEVTSYVGQFTTAAEFLGNVYSRIDLVFAKQGPSNGSYVYTFTEVGGGTRLVRGDYEIGNAGSGITLTSAAQGASADEYTIQVSGDKLKLDGLFDFDNDTVRLVIEAERD